MTEVEGQFYRKVLTAIASLGCEDQWPEDEPRPDNAFRCRARTGNDRDVMCNPCVAAAGLRFEFDPALFPRFGE